MSQISVNQLSFYYDGSYDDIFKDTSFTIDSDWKLGFIGRNGRGKTTFLKLLMGEYEYRGSIRASVDFSYFPYEVRDKKKQTVEVVEEVYPAYEFWMLCRELSYLDVDQEVLFRPFETLSNGEQTKVLLAVLFLKENSFLLIDEPTNHLDLEARQTVSQYLQRKNGFILVSHDRVFLDSCIDHVLAINKMDIQVVAGNFSSWWENKNRQDEYERQENIRLKKDIGRLTEAARQTAQWSDKIEKTKVGTRVAGLRPDRGHIGHMAAKMMKRSKVTERRMLDAIDEKSGLLKNIEEEEPLKIIPLVHHKSELVVIEKLSISYGGNIVLKDFNLTVQVGERVALQGKNGCGKSSVMRGILQEAGYLEDEQMVREGKITLASGLVISYVSQDTSFLSGSLKDFISEYKLDETLFKAILRKLDFSRVQFEKPLESYSGGQKKKILIARSLCEKAHLYLWDEPLNYIDLFSRMQIEALLKHTELTMIFVEHDLAFTEEIGDRIIKL